MTGATSKMISHEIRKLCYYVYPKRIRSTGIPGGIIYFQAIHKKRQHRLVWFIIHPENIHRKKVFISPLRNHVIIISYHRTHYGTKTLPGSQTCENTSTCQVVFYQCPATRRDRRAKNGGYLCVRRSQVKLLTAKWKWSLIKPISHQFSEATNTSQMARFGRIARINR